MSMEGEGKEIPTRKGGEPVHDLRDMQQRFDGMHPPQEADPSQWGS